MLSVIDPISVVFRHWNPCMCITCSVGKYAGIVKPVICMDVNCVCPRLKSTHYNTMYLNTNCVNTGFYIPGRVKLCINRSISELTDIFEIYSTLLNCESCAMLSSSDVRTTLAVKMLRYVCYTYWTRDSSSEVFIKLLSRVFKSYKSKMLDIVRLILTCIDPTYIPHALDIIPDWILNNIEVIRILLTRCMPVDVNNIYKQVVIPIEFQLDVSILAMYRTDDRVRLYLALPDLVCMDVKLLQTFTYSDSLDEYIEVLKSFKTRSTMCEREAVYLGAIVDSISDCYTRIKMREVSC